MDLYFTNSGPLTNAALSCVIFPDTAETDLILFLQLQRYQKQHQLLMLLRWFLLRRTTISPQSFCAKSKWIPITAHYRFPFLIHSCFFCVMQVVRETHDIMLILKCRFNREMTNVKPEHFKTVVSHLTIRCAKI